LVPPLLEQTLDQEGLERKRKEGPRWKRISIPQVVYDPFSFEYQIK
jgi:hypothetical protein